MKNKIIFMTLICLFLTFSIQAQVQKSKIPKWFLEDLKSNIGTWIADNSKYKSDQEPYEKYGIEWKYGIGNTSIIGRMFGIKDGQEIGPFWQFRQYWDVEKNQAVVLQFGWYGEIGAGTYKPLEDGSIEMIQTFIKADGKSRVIKHINKVTKDYFTSAAFEKKKGKWVKDRSTYKWNKVNQEEKQAILGQFSVSLSVKNIKASKEFYEKLGFQPVKDLGGIEKKWLVLTNGKTRIGIYQDIFQGNTLTFQPINIRGLYKSLQKKGIKATQSRGLDKKEGAASLIVEDPDGNKIFINQDK